MTLPERPPAGPEGPVTLPERPPAGPEGPRFLTAGGQPRAFVIVSSARSGSNLLVGYLRQLREAACFGEILREDFVDRPGWQNLVGRLDMPKSACDLHATDLTSFWDLFLAQGLRRRRWLGAKAFYYHRRDDPVWERFAALDHRIIHLWRDATFEQYVSRLLAVASGEWKSPAGGRDDGTEADGPADGEAHPDQATRVAFDRDDYLRYREAMRVDMEATRARYAGNGRFVEVEYRQLLDHDFVGTLLEDLFGQHIDVTETLRRQRDRPKVDYLLNPAEAEPFVADSIVRGFAPANGQ